MSKDTEIKGTTQFRKKPHRPWKLALLKEAIEDEAELNYPENLIPQSLSEELSDLSKDIEDQDTEFPDLSMDLEEPSEEFIYATKQPEGLLKKDFRDIYDMEELQKIIQAKMDEKQELSSKIHAQPTAPLLIGGFFNPEGLNNKDAVSPKGQVTDLMGALRLKEEELSRLTKSLELQRATEEAEQATIAKEAALKAKQFAEERTKQAIEQASISKQQLQIAVGQAKEAEKRLEEERMLNKSLERKFQEAVMKARNSEFALNDEQLLRKDAEIKSRLSLDQIVSTELAKKAIEKENEDLLEKLRKLQAIIDSEQNLRKLADHKYQQAIQDIENSEKARLEDMKQRRAQRKLLMDLLQDD